MNLKYLAKFNFENYRIKGIIWSKLKLIFISNTI
jgi:hypothetical protein